MVLVVCRSLGAGKRDKTDVTQDSAVGMKAVGESKKILACPGLAGSVARDSLFLMRITDIAMLTTISHYVWVCPHHTKEIFSEPWLRKGRQETCAVRINNPCVSDLDDKLVSVLSDVGANGV